MQPGNGPNDPILIPEGESEYVDVFAGWANKKSVQHGNGDVVMQDTGMAFQSSTEMQQDAGMAFQSSTEMQQVQIQQGAGMTSQPSMEMLQVQTQQAQIQQKAEYKTYYEWLSKKKEENVKERRGNDVPMWSGCM
jgi:hypothetical protein